MSPSQRGNPGAVPSDAGAGTPVPHYAQARAFPKKRDATDRSPRAWSTQGSTRTGCSSVASPDHFAPSGAFTASSTELDDVMRSLALGSLVHLGEPSLTCQERQGPVYRLLVLPPWGPPQSIRIDGDEVVVKVLARESTTGRQRLQIVANRKLFASEARTVTEEFTAKTFWTMPPIDYDDEAGTRDGVLWVIEARQPDQYNVVARPSGYRTLRNFPDDSKFRGLVSLMLKVGGL